MLSALEVLHFWISLNDCLERIRARPSRQYDQWQTAAKYQTVSPLDGGYNGRLARGARQTIRNGDRDSHPDFVITTVQQAQQG
jgi:hypothetical protein